MNGALKALMVVCLVGAVWVASPASPGSAVAPDQAARVNGGNNGYASHDFLLNATATVYCTGATYSGCGGGACGTPSFFNVSTLPGNRDDVSTVCGSKMCGGVKVTCGSAFDNSCI